MEQRWHAHTARIEHGVPEVGWILAADRRAWRVIEVRLVSPVDWDDDDKRIAADPGWGGVMPHYVTVTPIGGGRRRHFKIRGRWRWDVLPEHYPVCVECREPYPCLHLDAERASRRAGEELDRLTRIGPGCCWSCGERITPRQEATTFPGENLLLPGAPPAAFHNRLACAGARHRYAEKWQQAVDQQLVLDRDESSGRDRA